MLKRAWDSIASRFRHSSASLFMMAIIAIPVQEQAAWKQEKYSKIPKNEVTFSKEGLFVRVNKSASPLIYPLLPAKKILGFRVTGEFRGLPKFSSTEAQGQRGSDDYALRVGFVVPGAKRLSGVKKFFAPVWLKNLYSTIPIDTGIDGVRFFNVTQSKKQLDQERTHPSSDLITERFFALAEDGGKFDYSYDFKEPIEAAAIWLSIDGDDTKSKFDVLIQRLEIREK